jgi:type II restriction/modification system DNA methylase subunit YeeA
VPTEDIPAVTQLFTPHWIVRYLVENSLGRLWLLNRPGSRLREHMPYYIEGETETDFLKITKPEEIKLVDPAVGSGHMLTYAFDLLTLIYEEEGYAKDDIPALILRHNLHGMEICPRAAQLAELALVFKAREKSRRFFQSKNLVRPNITLLRDIQITDDEMQSWYASSAIRFTQNELSQIHQFRENTPTFGSLIQPRLAPSALSELIARIGDRDPYGDGLIEAIRENILLILKQALMLTQHYHVVVANPPYMGGRYMEKSLKSWAEAIYPDAKADTYAIFIQKCQNLSLKNGYFSLITMQSWMFLGSFTELRQAIFRQCSLVSMLHTGPGVFPELGAFNVLTTAFVFCHARPHANQNALFIKANDGPDVQSKIDAISDPARHITLKIDSLQIIPDFPLVYWLGERAIENFVKLPLLGSVCPPKQGMATGENAQFVRLWHEVQLSKIGFLQANGAEARASQKRWFPYNKGGNYRKWYGNNDCVVNWENDGSAIRNFFDKNGKPRSATRNTEYYFRKGIVYSLFGFENFGVRYKEEGFVFDVSGSSMFPSEDLEVVLAFLCSNVAFYYLKALAPTVNFQVGDLARLPLPKLDDPDIKSEVVRHAKANIELCKLDWNEWETSWEFSVHRLLRQNQKSLQAAWESAELEHNHRREKLKANEEAINEILISEYQLAGSVDPLVVERDLSIKPLVKEDAIAALLSYAVGCMMGRYSPECPGIILANAGDTLETFRSQIADRGVTMEDIGFAPDADGIIPMLDGEWFEDDLVARTKEFLRVTFGDATLNDNLRFIEQALGRELRDYFLTDFYKDHIQTYKNRPIYWLFSSGKQKAFQCLVYLHRYTPGTLARIRTEYAIPLQGKLAACITRLEEEVTQTSSSAARKKLQTELDKCKKQMVELIAFDEQLRSYADQAITLDLDDGVKTNYAKFGPLVAEAKKIYGTKDD